MRQPRGRAEGVRPDAEPMKLRRSDRHLRGGSARRARELDDLVRPLDREAAQEHGLEDTEHRARQADRETEDEYDGDAERRRAPQGARGERQIATSAVE